MPFLSDSPPLSPGGSSSASSTAASSTLHQTHAQSNDPIAIVGISLRGPGDGADTERFWQMLLDGRSARRDIPKDRYNVDGFYHPDGDRLGSIQQRQAHFLEQDFKVFDAPFFSVTPKEAKAMDPTHRMLLEATYEGFENAGMRLEDVAGTKTSVYVGTFTADFPSLQARDNAGPSIYHATGTSASLASNRLSWFYDLKGPSLTVDTACSSSLTAFHLGCQSLRTGEASMSVIAGANLMFGPDMSILLGAAKILSPEGRSKMWDASADGFARGEGIGVLVLKPLSAALRDGDTVRAVVLASATNEDGYTPGISLPNSEAQQELIRDAYAMAGVDPADTGYVEAHGTGTQAGDPLEARAIIRTIGAAGRRRADLYVGSVKTNIGHLEGAAGVAGVIKAALAVERGVIPRNLWFDKLNSQIKLPSNVKIPVETTVWPSSGPRRASVNSFGFGGANAHVILEDAASYFARTGQSGRHFTAGAAKALLSEQYSDSDVSSGSDSETSCNNGNGNSNSNSNSKTKSKTSTAKILVVSSNDQDGVKRNVETIKSYLSSKPQTDLADLAYTLNSKRTTFPWKSFAIARDLDSAPDGLDTMPAAVRSSNASVPRVAFAFTGQGAQWHAMGRGLSVYKTWRDSMAVSQQVLTSLGCPWSLGEELSRGEKDSRLRLTEYSQPICTALQIALVDLLRSWAVEPVAVVGHSSGEIAAAYAAGFLSHESAVKVAWLRGQVSGTVSRDGGMLAVNAPAEAMQARLGKLTTGRAVVACMNSPRACTISGDRAAVDELHELLKADEVVCTKLPMDVAYHSFHMEAAREQYEQALAGIPHLRPKSGPTMFSSVTGELVGADAMSPSYWVDNLVSPVNFTAASRSLLHHSPAKTRTDRSAFASVLVEIGPHSALRSYLLDVFKAEDRLTDLSYVGVLRRKMDAVDTALQAAGELWAKGCAIDVDRVNGTAPSEAKMLVDLPPYRWNHTKSFWEESHLSRQYRLRASPRTDLLGYRVPGVPDPTFRNFLRCTENPWIREHRVQGDVLYPGVGMVVMAVEAARAVADANEEVLGYELRDVAISTALRVPDDEAGVEVMTQLHARRTGTKAAPSNALYEFAVSSWSDDAEQWTVHARGLVSLTYRSSLTPAMQGELERECQARGREFEVAKATCQRPARSFLYDQVEAIGMVYGPTFRNMTELYAGPDANSYGVIGIPDTKKIMPKGFEYPFVVHPATFDSVLHLLFPCIAGEEESLSEAVVPFLFDRIFISAKMPTEAGTKLQGHCSARKLSYTTWTSGITVCGEQLDEPLIIMEGLGLASIGGSGSEENAKESRAGCFGQNWHEDVDLLSPAQIKELVYHRTLKSKDDDTVLDKLEYVCLVYIARCLAWFETEEGRPHMPTSGFWKLYVEWMHDTVAAFPPLAGDPAEVEAELQRCKEAIVHSPSGDITVQMVERIGVSLPAIFRREVEPLQVMTEGDLLYTFYRGAFGTSFNTNVAEYVGLIADKSPGLHILEIGAGTGGTTYHVLERLRNPDGTSKAARYFFSDISPGFLAKAADRFQTDASVMEFGTCNIENDPLTQGFAPESFDLIVCANVLHATKSIQETLTHCRALLKPGGRLVLSEVTIKRIFSGFIMGPLPGWWLGEDDGRHGGPLLDVPEWETALTKAGFSGVDMDVRGDREESLEPVSLIISTKPLTKRIAAADEFVVVTPALAESQKLAQAIVDTIKSAGKKCTSLAWEDVTKEAVQGQYCICLAEWESPILVDLTDENWARLRDVVLGSAGTVWVTGGAAMDTPEPLKSLMVGLARAIRNENAGVLLATLDLETAATIDMRQGCDAVLKVALEHSRGETPDGEFAARRGRVFVPRVERLPGVDASLRKYENKGDPEPVSFVGCGRPLKLTIKTPGLLDTFRWVEDETYHTPVPEDWVEIQVKAVGLNFKDVLVALGNLAEYKLGVDVSGVVTRVGAGVKDLKPGDKVMTASCDTFATFVRFPAKGAIPIPDDMTFEEAASMPLIFLTAYYALVTAGHLVAGERILIHAAAGGVGQAAIQIAQSIGAEIFATVGSDEKKQLIMDQYGIPADHIFSSRDTSFYKGVMRATDKQGVDVVLNSLAGEALRLSWHSLAKFGRFLEIGKADLFANTGLDMQPFLDNKSYIGVNLLDFENNPTPRAVALWRETAALIHDGGVRPVHPLQRFTMADVEKAFRYMQTGKHTGKVVVCVDEADVVPAIPRTPKVPIVADATYVVAGLGGICREIGRWLAEKGAKHLVFLSRTAASSAENKEFSAGLEKTYGAKIHAFDCDVGDKTALAGVLEAIGHLPKVRGCVTGAMVLHDTLFDSMTADHVRTTVGPKVHGTWNLHEQLPADLDFFVMLSSLAGVMGHRGQGNYGCGNIFQDYVAAHRRGLGRRATTVDIGYLLSVGFVAEHDEYVDHVKAMGLKVMRSSDLHGLLATAMEADLDASPAQVMCGLPYREHDDAWYWIRDGRFAALRNVGAAGAAAGSGGGISLREELARCGPGDDEAAVDLITRALVQRLAKLMMMPEADIDAGRPLSAYGVDSLVAVEVRNWVSKEVVVEVSVFDLMANVPMRVLAANLAKKSALLSDKA
ncbi:Type I Iterative PKS [Pyricularia oryzae]|nr:Type I Iterative PKS [Pyricularia oryzae]KAI6531072.1 Type I Iterative PKS [Pyricularia oryzae]